MVRRQRLKDVADASVQVAARVSFTKIPVLRVISSPFSRYGDVAFSDLAGRSLRSSRNVTELASTWRRPGGTNYRRVLGLRSQRADPNALHPGPGRTTVHLWRVAAAKTTR